MLINVEVKFVNKIPNRLTMQRGEYKKVVGLKQYKAIEYPSNSDAYDNNTVKARILEAVEKNFIYILKKKGILDLVEYVCPIFKQKDGIEYIEVNIKWKEDLKKKEELWKPKI